MTLKTTFLIFLKLNFLQGELLSTNQSTGFFNERVDTRRPAMTHALLTGGIVVKVEKTALSELVDYVDNNIVKKNQKELIYMIRGTKSVQIKKDLTVRYCSIIVQKWSPTDQQIILSSSNQKFVLKRQTIGQHFTIFGTYGLYNSAVTLYSNYDMYILCNSLVTQSWKIYPLTNEALNILDLLVIEEYWVDVRVEARGRIIKKTLNCSSFDQQLSCNHRNSPPGNRRKIRFHYVDVFYCYVTFGNNLRRYYDQLLITSTRQVFFSQTSRVFFSNKVRLKIRKTIEVRFSNEGDDYSTQTNNSEGWDVKINRHTISADTSLYVDVPVETTKGCVSVLNITLFINDTIAIYHSTVYLVHSLSQPHYQVSIDFLQDPSLNYLDERYGTTEYVYEPEEEEEEEEDSSHFNHSPLPLSLLFLSLFHSTLKALLN